MLDYKPIHYHEDNISRNNKDQKRRHVVLAAAYRSGESLHEERRRILHDKYCARTDVVHKEILLPENVPREFMDRETLWNAVDVAETTLNKTRSNQARTAKDIEFSLSNDKRLSIKSQIEIAREHAIETFVNRGFCVDMCVHDDGSGRPHVHLLIATRQINSDGTFSEKKCRELMRDKKYTPIWRREWAERLSYEFERRGLATRFFAESFKKRGIDREPVKFVDRRIYKNKIQTERVLENEAKKARNRHKELERDRELERAKTLDREMTREYES